MTAPYAAAQPTAPQELVVDEAELGPGVFSYWGARWPKWRQIALWFTIVFFICTVIMSPFGIWFMVVALRSPTYSKKARAKRVDLHQRGVVVHGAEGPVAVYRFTDLTVHQKITENYYNGVKTGTHYLLTLTGPDGRSSKLTQFYENIPHLMQTVQQGVVEAQLPRALATVQAGYPVPFGPFSVTQQGLICDAKTTVTWPLLDRIVVRQGVVRIMVHGRRTPQAAKGIFRIPNYGLFLTLVSNVRAQS
ncbi:hypothetical protein DN069_19455 [Streptacidiphilus pinicola]|uniref:Uncharacterized protein n=1 Tax=Streptacidiphilus pinicola TaxID=2219663 RepID=A0A2X0K8W5_9ACTN|nr:DUF6585 family protein [Streptacidiphilus pinicola]RAG83939.1 hypothetical protein DN069_19455 [Streptacidiphilus pinicola]